MPQPITRRLQRKTDGRLEVVYVNTQTGEQVSNPFTGDYTLIEQGNNLDFLDGLQNNGGQEEQDVGSSDSVIPEDKASGHSGALDQGSDPYSNNFTPSVSNNFGYTNKPGWMSYTGALPGIFGTVGKAANLGFNMSNTAAINSARGYIGLDPLGQMQTAGSFLNDRKGYVADVNIGQTPYSIGLEAVDPWGRTSLTPDEARTRSLVTNQPVTELNRDERKQDIKSFQKENPNAKQGLLGKAVQAGKGLVNGLVSTATSIGDLAANSQMQTPAPGTVSSVRSTATGLTVDVTHPDGMKSSFTGLESTNVSPGDQVAAGDIVGAIDPTKSNQDKEHYSLEDQTGAKVDASQITSVPGFDPSAIGPATESEISKGIDDGRMDKSAFANLAGQVDTVNGLNALSPEDVTQGNFTDVAPSFDKPSIDSYAGFTNPGFNPGYTSGINAPSAPTVSNQPSTAGYNPSNPSGIIDGIGSVPSPEHQPGYANLDTTSQPAQGFFSDVYGAAKSLGFTDTQAALAASQASLETGYGTSIAGNNMFGIKAGQSWKGAVQSVNTHEEIGGVLTPQKDNFRSYSTPAQSLEDYAGFMAANFADTWNADSVDEAIDGLNNGKYGAYATDSKYGAHLIDTMKSNRLANAQIDYANKQTNAINNINDIVGYSPTAQAGFNIANTAPTVGFTSPATVNSINQTVAADPYSAMGQAIANSSPTNFDTGRFAGPVDTVSPNIDPGRFAGSSVSNFDTGRFAGPSMEMSTPSTGSLGAGFDSGRFGGSSFGNSFSAGDTSNDLGGWGGIGGGTGIGGSYGDTGNYGASSSYSGGFSAGSQNSNGGYGGLGGGSGIGGSYGGSDRSGSDRSGGSSFGGGFGAGSQNSNGGYGGLGGGSGVGGSYGGSSRGESSSPSGSFGGGSQNSNGGYGGLGGGSGIGGSYGGGMSSAESGAAHGGQSTAGTGGAGGTNEGGLGGWGGW